MRYFWHAMVGILTLALIIFVFFAFSLNSSNKITFTDNTTLSQPSITIADPSIGDDDAAMTIVNFGDYQCEACATLDETLTSIAETFPGQIRLVWKDMPNSSLHTEATNAAVAARCAEKQDKFFEYHAYLFANQSSLGSDLYIALAEQLGLKASSFTRCVENADTLPLVQRSYEEGVALQIAATPTVFLNGERYTGSLTESSLTSAIRAMLAEISAGTE